MDGALLGYCAGGFSRFFLVGGRRSKLTSRIRLYPYDYERRSICCCARLRWAKEKGSGMEHSMAA